MVSKNRITKSRYDKVLWSRVCPGCGDYKVVDVHRRSRNDIMDSSKYLGSFHACGGPEGSRCWHMTRAEAGKPDKPLYETFGSRG
jgi:pyruvate/2-oxoacid:ferredoxin oxidoreductase beta subunit